MATLTDLQAQVRAATLAPAAVISDKDLAVWLNEGYYKVASALAWPWLEASSSFTTTAGTQAYAVSGIGSGAVDRIISIYSDSKRRLLKRLSTQDAFDAWGGNMPEGEHADAFFLWSGSIYLVPVPTVTATQYNVLYLKNPTLLAAAGSSPEWDPMFHSVLAHYGEMRVWQQAEDLRAAKAAESSFFQVLDRMATWYMRDSDSRPWAVGVPVSRLAGRTNTPFLDG